MIPSTRQRWDSRWIIRLGRLAPILSVLLWLILTPLMATVGICRGICGNWAAQPLVIRTLGRAAAERGWLSTASPDALYFGFGRYFFLVYLVLAAGLVALHHIQVDRANPTPLHRRAYRMLLVSLLVAAAGDFTSYGLGALSEWAWRMGYGVEVLSWIPMMVSLILYGIATLRLRVVHPVAGWLLIAAALLMPATFFDRLLVHYSPNAQLLPLVMACALIGAVMLLHRRSF